MANWVADFLTENVCNNSFPVIKRGRNSIHFQRPDGQIEAHFTGMPMHFRDSDGLWKPIDTTLKQVSEGFFGAPGMDFELHPDGRVRTGSYQHRIDLPGKPVGHVDEDKIIREFAGGKHTMFLMENGFREEIVLNKPYKAKWFIAKTLGNLSSKYYQQPLIAIDAKEQTFIYSGDIIAFDKWLENASYPVTIDPDFLDSTDDGYIRGADIVYAIAHSTTNTSSTVANILAVGQFFGGGTYYIFASYLKFDTSSIPNDYDVNQVNLKAVCTTNSSALDFDVQIIKQDWSAQDPITAGNRETAYDNRLTESQDDNIWRNTAGIVLNTQYTSGNLNTGWINKLGNTYYSLRSNRDFTSSVPVGEEFIYLASQDHATVAYRPVLTVLYSPGPALPPATYGGSQKEGQEGSSYEFWLTDDKGKRLFLMKDFAFASYSRTSHGLGTILFGLPLESFMAKIPIIFQPDWRIDAWRSPGYGFPKRRESSYFLRKFTVYDRAEDAVRMLTFYGHSPIGILSRGFISNTVEAQYKLTDYIDDMMKTIVTNVFITGGVAPSGQLTVDGDVSIGPSVSEVFQGKIALDAITELKEASFGLNFNDSAKRKIYFDVVEGPPNSDNGFGYIFRTYADHRGIDRTQGLVFSPENGNLINPEYSESYLDQATTVQVITTSVSLPDSEPKQSSWPVQQYIGASGYIASIAMVRQVGPASEVGSSEAIATTIANKILSQNSKEILLSAFFASTPGSPNQPRCLYGIDWDMGDYLPIQYAGININADVEIVWVSVDENGHENIVGANKVGT